MSFSYLTILNIGGIINSWSIDLVITNVEEAIGGQVSFLFIKVVHNGFFFYATYYSLCGFTLAPNRLSKWKS
jgi:hypothetical protein